MQSRTFITPMQVTTDLADGADGLTYWKQILPEAPIVYNADGESRRIDFNADYLSDLATSFKESALDQTPFMLADADNKHTMDPERYRGDVVDMQTFDNLPAAVKTEAGDGRGLWAKIKFSSKDAAKAVMDNPKLGVSARIREGIERADGKSFKRAIIHVLGTHDPKITGLRAWTPALDFSSDYDSDNVLDLSTAAYSEATVSAPTKTTEKVTKNDDGTFTFDFEAITDEEIAAFDDDTLKAFLAEYGDEGDEGDEGTEPEGGEPEGEPASTSTAPEAKLSNTGNHDLDFANAAAAQAMSAAKAAQKRTAEAEWRTYRSEQIRLGVPPHILDFAKPVIAQFDELIVDLSNYDEGNVNATAIVRKLVEGYKGTTPVLDVELGHGGADSAEGDPDAELMALADKDPRFTSL